jgi:MFS family permease
MSAIPTGSAPHSAAHSAAHGTGPQSGIWLLAVALSLAAAVSLGITRFSYGLLLPPMRTDLGWSYTLAGAMNTANAVGYLLGALSTPFLLRRTTPGGLMVAGSLLASVFMAGSGFFTDATPLLLQRLLAGISSAWVFVTGGLLAARLVTHRPARSGLLLGIYYGGTGWGIVASALAVPWVLAQVAQVAQRPHAWAWAWWALAGVCVLACGVLAWVARRLAALDANAVVPEPKPGPASEKAAKAKAKAEAATAAPAAPQSTKAQPLPLAQFAPALLAYALFGVGYIGYMTFVIALLREQGSSNTAVTVFYTLLGLAVVASSRIWSGWLDRYRNGQALARLNGLLGLAVFLPVVTAWWWAVLASGLLFGAVFLSVVASTTAWVRHNLPPAQWAAGISAFTIAFAFGQIVGPTMVGWVADGPGGLVQGLGWSALALWLGALVALRQKALPAN